MKAPDDHEDSILALGLIVESQPANPVWYERSLNRAAAYVLNGVKLLRITYQYDQPADLAGNAYRLFHFRNTAERAQIAARFHAGQLSGSIPLFCHVRSLLKLATCGSDFYKQLAQLGITFGSRTLGDVTDKSDLSEEPQ